MNLVLSNDEILYGIKIDLASVKTDVTWLKRFFTIIVITGFALLGLDVSGAV